MDVAKDVPDVVKLGVAVSPPTLTILGFPVEQWTFVLSAIVSILFIIEKAPMFIQRMKALIAWIKRVRKR